MSYDVSLMNGEIEVVDCGDFTRNVHEMLHEALQEPFIKLNGMISKDAIPILERAITRLNEDPDKYKALNSPNGWGKYEGVLDFLGNILANTKKYPKTVILIT